MAGVKYPWNRNFLERNPLTHGIRFVDGNPKLLDIVEVDKKSDFYMPCLIIAGEKDMGKSTILKELLQGTKRTLSSPDQIFEDSIISLSEYGSEYSIDRDIFDHQSFQDWVQGSYRLFVFFDALDEGIKNLSTMAPFLQRRFERYDTSRLFVRIACRSVSLSIEFTTGLYERWKIGNIRFCELNGLTENDVSLCAKMINLDYEKLSADLDLKGLSEFTTNPATLTTLLNRYERTGTFPDTRWDIYQDMCLMLCRETKGESGRLSADKKLSLASQIAYLTVFSKKLGITYDIEDTDEDYISISELLRFGISENDLDETLDSGLFAGSHQKLNWAQRSYAEFLAAYYMTIENNFSFPQLRSLISVNNVINSDFQETIAWLCLRKPLLFDFVATHDPQLLISSKILSALNGEKKRILISHFLRLLEEGNALDNDWVLRGNYHYLKHPSLTDQLRPYINDKTNNFIVRRAAIDIAETCQCVDLQDDLIQIALDAEENTGTRIQASVAIWQIGKERTRIQMKPLIQGISIDENDELKGYALLATWPDLISAKELFTQLAPPKTPNFYGGYHLFLNRFAEALTAENILEALEWVKSHNFSQSEQELELFLVVEDISEDILWKAWDLVDQSSEILESFVEVLILRASKFKSPIGYDRTFGNSREPHPFVLALKERTDIRRLIIITVLSMLDDYNLKLDQFIWETQVALPEDLDWLIDQWEITDSPKLKAYYLELIGEVFEIQNNQHVIIILDAQEKFNEIREKFLPRLGPIEIGSSLAQEMREFYQKRQEFEQKMRERQSRAEPASITPSPEVRIKNLIDDAVNGEVENWWKITYWLWVSNIGYFDTSSMLNFDVRVAEQWENLTEEDHKSLLEVARLFLLNSKPDPSDWLETQDKIFYPILAGYKALWLLFMESEDVFAELPDIVWKNWAPVVVAYVEVLFGHSEYYKSEEWRKTHIEFVWICYRLFPEVVEDTISRIIKLNNRNGFCNEFYWSLELCWDDNLLSILADKLDDSEWHPACLRLLLEVLLRQGSLNAYQWALEQVKLPFDNDEERKTAQITTITLVEFFDNLDWSIIEETFKEDEPFAHLLVSGLADGWHRFDNEHSILGRLSSLLTTTQLKNLYIWLEQNYPRSEDPKPIGFHEVSDREHVGEFRNRILQMIQYRANEEAIAVIEDIVETVGADDWLQWQLIHTKDLMKEKLKRAVTVSELVILAENAQYRLVRNPTELQELVIESLERLQKDLVEKPFRAVRDIWDRQGQENTYLPISEDEFSDYVLRHLRRDLTDRGIVPEREVQTQRRFANEPGQRTDLIVSATHNDNYETIQLIIEVKACWNDELLKAMNDQLKERYLAQNSLSHGIYLVAYFQSANWDAEYINKKNKCTRNSIDDLKILLSEQAKKLSVGAFQIRPFVIDASLK